MFKKILIVILLIFVIAVAGIYIGRSYIVKSAIETGSEYGLGVKTTLGSANLDLGGRSIVLNDYEVSNPEGYNGEFIMNIKHGMIDLGEGSIFADETRIDSLIFNGVNLSFEVKDQKGNFSVIQEKIKKIGMESSSENEHKFFIKKLAVRNIKVDAALDFLKQKKSMTFTVDNIIMENIGGDVGVTLSEIAAKLMKTLINRAKSSGSNSIPEMFNLDSEKLDELKSDVKDRVKDFGGSLLNK
jgi:hypothetical protein